MYIIFWIQKKFWIPKDTPFGGGGGGDLKVLSSWELMYRGSLDFWSIFPFQWVIRYLVLVKTWIVIMFTSEGWLVTWLTPLTRLVVHRWPGNLHLWAWGPALVWSQRSSSGISQCSLPEMSKVRIKCLSRHKSDRLVSCLLNEYIQIYLLSFVKCFSQNFKNDFNYTCVLKILFIFREYVCLKCTGIR